MSGRDGASTLTKGLRVLDCFETGQSDLTMADIAKLTGFDRATARRLVLGLEESGYLQRKSRHFRLTAKVMAIAGGYLSSNQIGKSVQPVLNQCAEELKGEIALAVRDGNRAIYIARSAVSAARLSFGFSIGSTLPLLPTSIGRMLLAQCDDDLREAIIQSCPLKQYTPTTDIDPLSLRERIKTAAQQGFSYVSNEFELGAAGIAIPVANIRDAETVLATTTSDIQLDDQTTFNHILHTLRRAALSLRE